MDSQRHGYNSGYQKRGQAVIIVNECFYDPRYYRKGAHKDLTNMVKLLTYLDFHVISERDCGKDKMLQIISKGEIDSYVVS